MLTSVNQLASVHPVIKPGIDPPAQLQAGPHHLPADPQEMIQGTLQALRFQE